MFGVLTGQGTEIKKGMGKGNVSSRTCRKKVIKKEMGKGNVNSRTCRSLKKVIGQRKCEQQHLQGQAATACLFCFMGMETGKSLLSKYSIKKLFAINNLPLQLLRGIRGFHSSLLELSSVETVFFSSKTNSYFPFPDLKLTDKIIMQENCYTTRLVWSIIFSTIFYCYKNIA